MRGDVPSGPDRLFLNKLFSPRARGCSRPGHHINPDRGVFPACAGMFPARFTGGESVKRFPRVRGDVPTFSLSVLLPRRFSPRARGCSRLYICTRLCAPVFPACAGMFRIHSFLRCGFLGFPRVRGDVPFTAGEVLNGQAVFPACAGMFPCHQEPPQPSNRFPRVRGDVPSSGRVGFCRVTFSPRARGCSPTIWPAIVNPMVFPACAGMFRHCVKRHIPGFCFPRVRGDVP